MTRLCKKSQLLEQKLKYFIDLIMKLIWKISLHWSKGMCWMLKRIFKKLHVSIYMNKKKQKRDNS